MTSPILAATTYSQPPSVVEHFHPNVWDAKDFAPSSPLGLKPLDALREAMSELEYFINYVKSTLSIVVGDLLQELDLIDKLQRLGVAYHFEAEIGEILWRISNEDYTKLFDENVADYSNLYFVSLFFRLLRQGGYYVSADVFNKFKDEKSGDFRADLTSDVQSMLSLYEASYLGFNGEDILDKAMCFTTKHLKSLMASPLSPEITLQVQQALKKPLQIGNERVQARHYISIYERQKSHNENLLRFAKLDYNRLQEIFKGEIRELIRWWDDLDIKSKVPWSVRDRVVEAYAITNISCEPHFSLGRMHLAKIWIMLTAVDDAHDVYGNLQELAPLRDAFERWDGVDLNELADHMKVLHLGILGLYDGIKEHLVKKGHFVEGIPLIKNELQIYLKGLFDELKMLYSKELPTLEEWLAVSTVTTASNTFALVIVMNWGVLATREICEWIDTSPKFIKCSSILTRLYGDIASLEVELRRGVVVTSVPCYMNQHGVSKEDAIKGLRKMILTLWKEINEESVKVKHVPMRVFNLISNLSRNIGFYYDDDDGFVNASGRTKDVITSLMIDPIPI